MIEPCPPQVTRLIRRLEQVASEADIPSLCQAVKNVLVEELGTHRVTVPEKFLEPVPDGYARRCLFKDPEGRFTVVAINATKLFVMAWILIDFVSVTSD